MTIQGTGNNTRRYLHGSDAADAFDTILHCGDVGETYNIDSRDEISNITVASLILEQFKRSLTGSIDWIPDRPFNDSEYRVDGSKLEALGWRQKVGFAQGLSETVEWYRKNMSTFWTKIEKSPCPSGVKEEKFLARKTPVGGMKARMGARRHSEVMVEE
jgi:dTDP-D-glucose 4,6-dehydratase